mmetsp:Transcript_47415/g.149047  ORF Transcript_47415/g.149047 Transcript_47415/m.149047 type:complete len:227 (+) Transcript_47415:3-683(+)
MVLLKISPVSNSGPVILHARSCCGALHAYKPQRRRGTDGKRLNTRSRRREGDESSHLAAAEPGEVERRRLHPRVEAALLRHGRRHRGLLAESQVPHLAQLAEGGEVGRVASHGHREQHVGVLVPREDLAVWRQSRAEPAERRVQLQRRALEEAATAAAEEGVSREGGVRRRRRGRRGDLEDCRSKRVARHRVGGDEEPADGDGLLVGQPLGESGHPPSLAVARDHP